MTSAKSKHYEHILIAVDLHIKSDKAILERATAIAKAFKVDSLSLVHSVEHIHAYGIAQAYPAVVNFEEEMTRVAKEELAKLGKTYGIPVGSQIVEFGSPKTVIMDKAQELKADLIIVGSHGRHGLALLLGSTANAVLHHAHCDVLAVHI